MLKAIVTGPCTQFCIFYCRQLSLNATNRQADNIITNCLFRLAVQCMKSNQRTSFEKQHQRVCDELAKSPMSKGSETLALGFNTIISQEFMGAHRTASLSPENLGLFRTRSGYLVQCWRQWYDRIF